MLENINCNISVDNLLYYSYLSWCLNFFMLQWGWNEGKEYQSLYFCPYGLSSIFNKLYHTKANLGKCEKAHFKGQIHFYVCLWSFYFIK